ncbi:MULTISPECIES: ABC transporter ATP-binding protein [unclassified Microbacterium]|uniref:ABC transporter ATP-binding protein n=1 Tax=unclassified Microbacterium TaxID=2609290 RepID=UPI0036554633
MNAVTTPVDRARTETAALRIRDLEIGYVTRDGLSSAVRGVSLDVARGEFVGLVGESGCGKSTIAQAILRVLRAPGVITGGSIELSGVDVLAADHRQLRRLRWARAAIVMQNSLAALNPVQRVGAQIGEAMTAHGGSSRTVGELLDMVGIDPARARSYPHEFSGGMRQRAAIAMSLALEPDLLIMDEPTTALDVIVQQEILLTVRRLQKEQGFGVLFITHDLPLLLRHADRAVVMRDGIVLEEATTSALRGTGGADPYTRKLLAALPRPAAKGSVPASRRGAMAEGGRR